MDKKQEVIVAKKIESGEYFSDAMSWFHAKFTRPRTEASYFFIIATIAIISLCIGIAAFSSIFPLAPGTNFVISRSTAENENIKISSIERPRESVNSSVIKYMLNEYVKSREEYSEDIISRNFRVVTAFSDETVASEYANEIALTNSQSPLVVYSNRASVKIRIMSMGIYDSNGKPATDNNMAKATIRYARVESYIGVQPEVTQHEADITFQYDQIIVDQETAEVTQDPKLVVTGYKTRKLEETR